MQGRGQVIYQVLQGLVNVRIVEEVVIIQHQQGFSLDLSDLVQEGSQSCLFKTRLGREQQVQGGVVQRGIQPLEGGSQVGQETSQVIIIFIEGQPGCRQGDGAQPIRQQGSLSETCWSGDQDDLAGQPLVQEGDKPRPGY